MKKAEGGCQMADTGKPMPRPAVVQVDFQTRELADGSVGRNFEVGAVAPG